jgi:hypothetical protein
VPGMMWRATGGAAVIVAALLPVGCMGGDAGEPEPAGAAAEPEPELLPPSELAATSKPFRVRLTWESPEAEVDGFTVSRDGFRYPNLSSGATSYVDDTVIPGRTYVYEVASVRGRENSDELASTTVKVVRPPLRAARLEGWFRIKGRVNEWNGYGERPKGRYGIRFRPRCREGACDVRWKVYDTRARGSLRRRGARYGGTYSGIFSTSCEGSKVSSEVTIQLRLTAARAFEREWRGVRLRGSIEEAVAAQLGCRSAYVSFAVRGRMTDG